MAMRKTSLGRGPGVESFAASALHFRTSIVRPAVRRGLFVDPVLLAGHTLSPRHLPGRASRVEGAALGAVAERPTPVASHRVVPAVDDDLDRHFAAPHAG